MTFDLVDLSLPREGYREFISTWIFKYKNQVCIVDPGPSNSLQHVYKRLDGQIPHFCLLTHIHVDHAGGVGELCRMYPSLMVYAADNAVPHLEDPTRLIEGSQKTLGTELMNLYGRILPISRERLLPEAPLGMRVIETPGHAAHHISYVVEDLVFCGEAIGVRFGENYLRPATPIKFNYTVYVESIKKLAELKSGTLCFGHYGHQQLEPRAFKNALDQINVWITVVKDGLKQNKSNDQLIVDLLSKDALFSTFTELPKDIQKRERSFIYNSIDGIKGFIEDNAYPI